MGKLTMIISGKKGVFDLNIIIREKRKVAKFHWLHLKGETQFDLAEKKQP
jgi:hypothetical protein